MKLDNFIKTDIMQLYHFTITILVITFVLKTWCFCLQHVFKYYKYPFQIYFPPLGESVVFHSCDWHLFLPYKFLSTPALPPCRSHSWLQSKCGFLKIKGRRSNIPQKQTKKLGIKPLKDSEKNGLCVMSQRQTDRHML